MKPDFALNLSPEGAELLRRGVAGWERLGAVRFDQPDLDKALAALREEAGKQAPEGLFTKLVIPATEMRYVTVLAPGPTDEARRLQIEAEIDGLTPYAVDELAYDFVVEGDYALVALAAHEILAQAEDFAASHGFNPVAFVAIPETGAFLGEPFLGETRQARNLLPAGEAVVADARPVQMAGSAGAAASTGTDDEGAGARTEPTAAVSGAGLTARRALSAAPLAGNKPPTRPRVEITPRPRPDDEPAFASPVARGADEEPGGIARVGDLVRRMGNRLRRERASAAAEAGRAGGGGGQVTATPASADAAPGEAQASPPQPSARFRLSAPAGTDSRNQAAAADTAAPERASVSLADTPPDGRSDDSAAKVAENSSEPPLAFSTRRKQAPAPTPRIASRNQPGGSSGAGPGGRLAVLPAAGAARDAGKGAVTGALGQLVGGTRNRIGEGLRQLGKRGKGAAGRGQGTAADPASKEQISGKTAPDPVRAGAGRGADSGRRLLGGLRKTAPPTAGEEPIVPASRPPLDEAEKATEAEALTIFGARGHSRREPLLARKGLMAVGGVFLLLGAVATWALFFDLDRDQPAEPGLAQVAPEAELAEPDEPATGSIEAPAALPDADTAATMRDEPEAASPPDAQAVPADPEALLEELVRDGLREAQPAELLDSPTDPATAAAPDPSVPDEESGQVTGPAEPAAAGEAPGLVALSAADTAQPLALPAPLERPATDEVMPVSAAPPPPPGVEFDLGDDGLVVATPEGALSPRGVLVHAGQPEVVPPPRPAGIAPAAPATTEAPTDADEAQATPDEATPDAAALLDAAPLDAAPDDTPRADPDLAGLRPEPRSPNVTAAAAAAAEEAASEAEAEAETQADDAPAEPQPAPGDSSALTPPGGIAVAALRPQQRPTDLVPPTRAATAQELDLSDATEEAVARSLVPSARPEDMGERVRAALAAAQRTQDTRSRSTTQPVRGGDAPQIPTSASVAERATESGLNLRRVNLIGVYGTSSDRRALVRLSNGRIVRVGVGDSLDGGQVSAIGDSELRYVRRGRNQVLRIGQSG